MKKRTLVKMILDLVLTVLYLQLMFGYAMSPLFHEIAGIGIGVLFAIHVAINAKPIKGMLSSWGKGKLTGSRRVLLLMDCILPLGMFVSIATGLLIANELFVSVGGYTLVIAHEIASYACLGILLVHVALHVKYLTGVTKQFFKSRQMSFLQKVGNCAAACALVLGLLGSAVFLGLDAEASFDSSVALEATVSDTTTTTATTRKSAYRSSEEETYSSSSDDSSTSVSSSSADTTSDDTSSSGDLYCTACGKHCLLTNPQCSRGVQA